MIAAFLLLLFIFMSSPESLLDVTPLWFILSVLLSCQTWSMVVRSIHLPWMLTYASWTLYIITEFACLPVSSVFPQFLAIMWMLVSTSWLETPNPQCCGVGFGRSVGLGTKQTTPDKWVSGVSVLGTKQTVPDNGLGQWGQYHHT